VIPVAIGMLWLPWVRRTDERWIGFILAVTVGLLVFLGIEAFLEGLDLGQSAPSSLGGPALVFLGGAVAYLALAAVDGHLRARRDRRPGTSSTRAVQLAFLVALGIGLHNLGEGLAIGSAYAVGALALGTSLVVGFAVHNTTEGLAIVAPVSEGAGRARWRTLAPLGLIAGAPAIVGAWVGASLFDASLAAFMFGVGAGAIAQVIVQIGPMLRDGEGRLLHPLAVGGLLAGLALMYFTNLLIAV
jgi:zinc transporter ZupT